MNTPKNQILFAGQILALGLIAALTSISLSPKPLYAESKTSPAPAQFPLGSDAKQALAQTFGNLLEQAVPLEYDKKKDWGKTKNITVGIRNDGLKLSRRKKPVKHGVWKHYKVKMVEPEQRFDVQIKNLESISSSRVSFTLVLDARVHTWARAKVYQYGIHLIALELVGETNLNLAFDCEIGVQLQTTSGSLGLAIDPQVTDARLELSDFQLKRVSNASGPLVHELSSGLRRAIEHELKGPKLVAKINRSIEKRRDRLEIGFDDLLDSSWWPLASLPEVQRANRDLR